MKKSPKNRYRVKGIVIDYGRKPYGYMLYDKLTSENEIAFFEECRENINCIENLSIYKGNFYLIGAEFNELPIYNMNGDFISYGTPGYNGYDDSYGR